MQRKIEMEASHVARYSQSGGHEQMFYVRCLVEKIPEGKELDFKEDRNYPVLAVDAQTNKLLVPDNTNKLLWLPTSLFRFVKIA